MSIITTVKDQILKNCILARILPPARIQGQKVVLARKIEKQGLGSTPVKIVDYSCILLFLWHRLEAPSSETIGLLRCQRLLEVAAKLETVAGVVKLGDDGQWEAGQVVKGSDDDPTVVGGANADYPQIA